MNAPTRAGFSGVQKVAIVGALLLLAGGAWHFFQTQASTEISLTLTSNPNLKNGLVGHWTFDGKDMTPNVRDKSGQGNHGGLILGASGNTSTTTVPGKLGQALEFDGVDDYVDVGTGSSLNPISEMTIEAWFKTSASGVIQTIYYSYLSSSDAMQFRIRSDKLEVRTDTGASWTTFPYISGAKNVTDGEWHHGVFVLSNSGQTLTVYLDGVSDGTITGDTVSGFSPTINGIGGNIQFFNGSLDDVRIYDRALSADEISRLYELGATTHINTTLTSNPDLENGLVGHWTFDGKDMTPNVRDRSGQGNHGNLANFTSTTTSIGRIGQALEFDGSNDYVNAGSGSSLDNLSTITIAAWIYPTGWGGGAYGRITDKGQKVFYLDNTGSGGRVETMTFYQFFSGSDGYWYAQQSSIKLNQWQHVVLTYNSSATGNNPKFYLNSTSKTLTKGSTPTGSADSDAASNLFVGDNGGGTRAFQGKMDDLRIYNRILSADEISRLYELGATTYVNTTITSNPNLENGLVGHWTFDGQDMTPNVRDRSGQGNHGGLILGASGNTATTTAIGAIGQALEFDGVDDYVQLPVIALGGDTGTMGGWFKSSTTTGSHRFVGRYWQQHSVGLYNGNYGGYWNNTAVNSGIAIDTEWHHLMMTYDGSLGSDNIKLYLDGTAIKTVDVTGSNLNEDIDWQIGAHGDAGMYWNGQIDDVRIYNRALSAAEIKRLYNLGR